MAEHTDNKNIVMGLKFPEKSGNHDSTHKPNQFEFLQRRVNEAVTRMMEIQAEIDKLLIAKRKFSYEAELDELTEEVDRCTKEMKLLKLKGEKRTKIIASLSAIFASLLILFLLH